MVIEIQTKISVAEQYGKGVPNIVLEDAKFWGRPNFSGEMNQFKDARPSFTVLIPNENADQLRAMGYNVKTTIPRTADEESLSHLKVMVDFRFDKEHPGDVSHERGPSITVIMGEQREKLTSLTAPILDRSRIESMDMEIRGWEYNAEENPGQLSARLVMLVANMRPSILEQKYGRL